LGARCAYAGVLGRDELTAFALSRMEREGIDVPATERRSSAGPAHSHIIVDRRHGTRNIFSYRPRGIGASLRTPAALIASCRVLLVDHVGVPGMIRAARIARRAGIPVVADIESDHHSRAQLLLDLADHLIISQAFGQKLTGATSPEQALHKLINPGRQATVITCGAQGCWYAGRDCSVPKHEPAFKVRIVDTTGCGDVFHGAYAFALVRGLPLAERIRFAAAAAALKAARPGGQAGIPSLRAVRNFLKNED
jgi:sulfofructose kinase